MAAFALLAAAQSVSAATPGAEGPQRVLLVEDGYDSFLERVGSELSGMGFVLVRKDARGPLEQVARAEGVEVAIRVLPSRKGVEVWMSDVTSGRSLLRQVIIDESPGGPDQSLIALQTAELLRTSLLAKPTTPAGRASNPPQASSPKSKPPLSRTENPQAPSSEPSSASETGLLAAVGPLYSPGGAGSALELMVSIQRSFSARLGAALDLGAPLHSATLSGVEGSAAVATYMAGVVLLTRVPANDSRWFANAGIGLAALRLTFNGQTQQPLVSTAESALTAAAYVRADAGLALAPFLRLGFRATAGTAMERIHVRFAGNDAGSWGPGFLGIFGLVEMAWR